MDNLISLNLIPYDETTPKLLENLDDLQEFKRLNCLIIDGKKLNDLEGIKDLNIIYLDIHNLNAKCDMSVLYNLPLKELFIRNLYPLCEISLLKYFFNNIPITITKLVLNNINLTDISFIKRLVNLTELILINNSLSDLSPLANLTKLEYLDLRWNDFKEDEIYHLRNLDLKSFYSNLPDYKYISIDFKEKIKPLVKRLTIERRKRFISLL